MEQGYGHDCREDRERQRPDKHRAQPRTARAVLRSSPRSRRHRRRIRWRWCYLHRRRHGRRIRWRYLHRERMGRDRLLRALGFSRFDWHRLPFAGFWR